MALSKIQLLFPYNSVEYPWIIHITDLWECKFGKIHRTSVRSLKILAVMAIAVGDKYYLVSNRKRMRQLEKLFLTHSLKNILMPNLLILRKMVIDSRSRCIVAKCQNMTKQNAMVCGLHKKECSECHSRFCIDRIHKVIDDRDATCEECTPRCYKCGYPQDETGDTCFKCSY